jgi:uncharacterized protein YbaP (TraB family)
MKQLFLRLLILPWVWVPVLTPAVSKAGDSSTPQIRSVNRSNASAEARPAEQTGWKPLLWKISGDGIEPGYVLGTIHFPTRSTLRLPAEVQEAFDKASSLHCEIAYEPEAMRKLAAAFSQAPKPLTKILPKEVADRCEVALQRIHASLHLRNFDRMELWAFSVQLSLLEDLIKNSQVPPLDPRLYQAAKVAGKTVGGLETVEEQIAVMQHSLGDPLVLLQKTLEDMDQAAKVGCPVSKPLLDAFLGGNVADLQAYYDHAMSRYPREIREVISKGLITDRNRVMSERISKQLRAAPSQSHFFAVGAMHTIGTESLPNLLQREGFTVERVTPVEGSQTKPNP